MTKPVRALKFSWQPEAGILVVAGADGEHPVAIPIAGLPMLATQAKRFMAGLQTQEARKAGGDWVQISPATVQTCRVQTMLNAEGPSIVLIFDPGSEAEYPVSFQTPGLARDCGAALIEEAETLLSAPQDPPPKQ